MKSPFWPLPSMFLTGTALAAGLALINSLGNFAGYLGPIVVGYAKDATGSFEAGLYALAGAAVVSTVTALGCALWMPAGRRRRRCGWRRCVGEAQPPRFGGLQAQFGQARMVRRAGARSGPSGTAARRR